jgi:hypothetical protein
VDVTFGSVDRTSGGCYGMTNLEARVPKRVQHLAQNRLGQLRFGGRNEQQIDVRMGRQISAPVPTDRDHGYGGRVPERFHRQRVERAVDIDRTLLRYTFAFS